MSLTGKQAIGAGSGIGAALCRALVPAGADVVCTDVDGAAAAHTAEGLHGPGAASSAPLDVTDAAAVAAAVDEVVTSYVMTKHAVVGLSLALRSGAVSRGVGVLAVCPAAVETPILDKGAIGGFVGRDYYLRGQSMKTAYDPDRLARNTVRASERNKALLVVPKRADASWMLARLAPGLLQRLSIRFVAQQRNRQQRGHMQQGFRQARRRWQSS